MGEDRRSIFRHNTCRRSWFCNGCYVGFERRDAQEMELCDCEEEMKREGVGSRKISSATIIREQLSLHEHGECATGDKCFLRSRLKAGVSQGQYLHEA